MSVTKPIKTGNHVDRQSIVMSEEDWPGQVEVEMPTKLRAKNTLDSESESDGDISHSGALECSLVGLTSSRLCLMIRG